MPECETCHTPLEQRGTRFFCPACLLREMMGEDDDDDHIVDDDDATVITPAPASGEMPRVPRYSMIEKLGEGGFANVYRAQQREPVRREVAVKVLKPQVSSFHVLARFEAERQTLARMEHPGIARLWDSGVTMHGQPFFAMELVRGEPVTSYCARYELDLRQRLEIFMSICEAVQHAHEKGVLHRDLKPTNILVAGIGTEREVKIIDFGIAKALEVTPETEEDSRMTSMHQTVGTPGYMSPEQSAWGAHHVDARSDLYALGVVLYELLTGFTPLQIERRANDEARHRPHALHITPPSHLPQTLMLTKTQKRDLDSITLKALETDSARRYASAAALADDVQRHLRDEPVLAGEKSWTYVMEKFTRRHKSFVISSAVALLAVVAGFTASTILYFKEQKARTRAQDTQLVVEALEAELRRTLSRADFAAAQQFKSAGEEQSAVACLTRALRQDPEFKVAAADLQMMLIQDDSPQPVEKVIPVDPAWGEAMENLAAVSAGGHVLAVVFRGEQKQRLMLFRHQQGEWQRREIPLLAGVGALALAPSGNLLALAEDGQDVRLLRSDDPTFEKKWTPPSPVTTFTVSTVTELAAVGCKDGSVWFLSGSSDLPPKRMGAVAGEVTSLNINQKERWVIAAGKGGEVRRMEIGPTEKSTLLLKLPGEIRVMSLAGTPLMVAAGDSLGNVACHDAQGVVILPETRLHESGITALVLASGQGQLSLLSAGGARDLRVRWTDLKTRAEVKMPVESAGAIKRLVMTRGTDGVVIVNADASVRMWRKAGEEALTVRKPQRARFLAMSSQGRCMAVRRDLGKALEVLQLPQDPLFGMVVDRAGTPLPGLKGRECLAFLADGQTLVESNGMGQAGLWNAGKASALGTAQWPQPALALMPRAHDTLLAALADGSLIEVVTDGSKPVTLVPAMPDVAWTLAAISPDGRAAVWATASPDLQQPCRVRVWWAEEAAPREMKAERLSSIAVHGGTRAIALGLGNGHVRIVHDGEDLRGVFIPLHQSAVTSLAFSPDGKALITGSTDRTAAVWDARRLTPLTDAFRLGEPVQRVVFSGDGQRFACAADNQVVVGDLAARALLGQPFELPNLGRTLALNHDGTRVAFALGGGNTFIHDIAPAPTTAVPDWFLKLADIYVSRRMTPQGTIEVTDHPGLTALRQLPPENKDSEWHRFSTWMFTHTGMRKLTPWAELNLEEYLREVQKRPALTREIENRRLRTLIYHERDMGGVTKPPVQ